MNTDIASGTAGDLFRAGRIEDAVGAASDSVRRRPTDIAARVLLAELLLFAGDHARADKVLLAADALEPEAAMVIAEFRQLLRAAEARRELVTDGRLPEFLGGPTEAQQRSLAAFVALRSGDREAAAREAAEAEAVRPRAAGLANGAPIADFRDADDLQAGNFEILTTTGKYYWIPVERIASAAFHKPVRPRDLFWRRCTMSVEAGPEGEVYVPALYEPWPGTLLDDTLRLGRATSWSEAAPILGAGQRVFLIGEEGVAATALDVLSFAGADAP